MRKEEVSKDVATMMEDFKLYCRTLQKDSDIHEDFLVNYSDTELYEAMQLAYSAYYIIKKSNL